MNRKPVRPLAIVSPVACCQSRGRFAPWIALPCFATISVLVSLLGPATSQAADEPMQAFTEALRDRGYYQVAIEYLDSLSNSRTISDQVRQRLPLEQAITYNQFAAAAGDLRKAGELLARAQRAIDRYQPNARTSSDAEASQVAQFRGDLWLSRARIAQAVAATRRQPNENQTSQAQTELRTLLESAREDYVGATEKLKSAIRNFQIDPSDDSTKTQLKQLRGNYTYLKTRPPVINEMIAQTYLAGSAERKELLERTAAEATEIWEKYDRYSPALEAALTAAKCYQQLNDHQQCIGSLQPVFTAARNAGTTTFKRQAFAIAADSWQQTTPYPAEVIITLLEPATKMLDVREAVHPEWLQARLALARAYQAQSESVASAGGDGAARKSQSMSAAAIELARSISQALGTGDQTTQQAASKLLAQWNGGAAATPTAMANVTMPKTFVAADQQGKTLVQQVEKQLRAITTATRGVQQATSAAEQQRAKSSLQQLRAQVNQQADQALAMFDAAIRLRSEETTREQINRVRYLQSFCYFAKQQYLESSVIAQFLLDRFPNVTSTSQASSILLKSQSLLLDRATTDKALARRRLHQTCLRIVDQYPGTSYSADANAKLAQLALLEGQPQQARRHFDQIPPDDPQRARLAISLGRRLWIGYSKSKSDPATDASKQLDGAKIFLSDGLKQIQASAVNYSAAEGALLLAEALLASGETQAAIDRLESATVAPLALIKQSHPALVRSGRLSRYHQRTAMTAIKAYMLALRESPNQQAKWIERTQTVISELQASLAANREIDPDAAKRLMSLYRLISKNLLEQFDSIENGRPRIEFANSLANFLTQLGETSSDPQTVVWAGSTLLSVADEIPRDSAKPIFDSAVATLDRAQTLGFGSGDQAALLIREVKRQRALAQRGAGNFDAATDLLTELLSEKAGDLQTQIDAAMTLHQQGMATQKADAFAKAILGAKPTRDEKTKRQRNTIWGWRKLVKATRGNEKYADAFYESLYHMIEARYQIGRVNNSADGVQKAMTELDNWQQRDATFGGTAWQAKFESLKNKMQK